MTDATGTRQVPASSVVVDTRTASPSKARRRLILAAGAVLPSVYTLSSGAGTAAASGLVCVTKQQTALPPRFTTDGDYARWPDGWVRAPVRVGEYDGTPADCITSPQSACSDSAPGPSRDAANSLLPAESSYSKAQDGSVWVVQGNRVVSSSHVPITNIDPGRKHYGLVYVDETGTVSTLDPQGKPHLKPVTASCWASMTAGQKSKLG